MSEPEPEIVTHRAYVGEGEVVIDPPEGAFQRTEGGPYRLFLYAEKADDPMDPAELRDYLLAGPDPERFTGGAFARA